MSESKSEIEKMREAFDLAENYYIIPKSDPPEKWVEEIEHNVDTIFIKREDRKPAKLKWRKQDGEK